MSIRAFSLRGIHWQAFVPLIVAGICLLLLAWPAAHIGPVLAASFRHGSLPEKNSAIRLVELGRSEHFVFLAPEGYLNTSQVQAYLKKAEQQQARLVAYLFAQMRSGPALKPLPQLWVSGHLWNPNEQELSRMRYLEAGSFTDFLIQRYGLEKYLLAYNRSEFRTTYNQPLETIEAQWLESLQRKHFVQALAVSIAGVAVLWLFYAAIYKRGWWFLSGLLSWTTFLAWSFYLVYPLRVPLFLLASGILADLSARRRALSLGFLLVFGAMSLVIFVLWPAIQGNWP